MYEDGLSTDQPGNFQGRAALASLKPVIVAAAKTSACSYFQGRAALASLKPLYAIIMVDRPEHTSRAARPWPH